MLSSSEKVTNTEEKQDVLLWKKKEDFTKIISHSFLSDAHNRNIFYNNLQKNKIFSTIALYGRKNSDVEIHIFIELDKQDTRKRIKNIFPKTYPFAEMFLYSYHVIIPSIKFLESLLDNLILIDQSVSEISLDILANARLALTPSLKEWKRYGNFQDVFENSESWFLRNYESQQYNKNVCYKNYALGPAIRELELFGQEDGSVKLRLKIKSEDYSSAKSLLDIQFEPKFYFVNRNTNDFIWDIPNVAFLESFLANATKVEPSLKYIADDLFSSFDPGYVSRQKLAFLSGFHDRVGKGSAIHSVFKKNTIADPHLIEPILSYLSASRSGKP